MKRWNRTVVEGGGPAAARPRASAPRDEPADRGRRGLFAGVMAASAAATLAGTAAAGAAPASDRRALEYRETDHIRHAYRRMRF